MRDKTLGELVATLARYKAQAIPLAVVLIIGVFFEGVAERSESAASPVTAATGAPQVGSASVPPALAGSTGGVPDYALPDLTATGEPFADGTRGEPDAPAPDGGDSPPPGPATFTCDQDASLPMPVIAPAMEQLRAALPPEISAYVAGAAGCSPGTDPLSLVVAQLGPLLGAAGPALDALAPVTSMLPPIPVPPPVPLPALPAELNPALAAAYPVTSEACGPLAASALLIAVLASFPLPVTAQHAGAVIGPVYGVCSSLTGPGVPAG